MDVSDQTQSTPELDPLNKVEMVNEVQYTT